MNKIDYDNKARLRLLERKLLMANGCWYYSGFRTPAGYGQLHYDHSTWDVHRLSMKLFKPEEFDKNLNVNHKCNNPSCFNPEHLYSGTQKDNIRDCINSGNKSELNRTHCPQGHDYTPENTYVRPNGHRDCKICASKKGRKEKARKTFFSDLNKHLKDKLSALEAQNVRIVA